MSAPLFIPFFIAHAGMALAAADDQRGWAAMVHTALCGLALFSIAFTGGAFA